MLATNVSEENSPVEKLRWAFRMYDTDSSGSVNDMFYYLLATGEWDGGEIPFHPVDSF